MLAYDDMSDLHERLEDAFAVWGSTVIGQQFSRENSEKVTAFLSDEGSMVTVLAASTDDDEVHIQSLTRMQYSAFRGILGSKRVHVRGPAGSGKTLLAMWAAEAFAAEGQRVLFLCYNQVLAAWLEDSRASSSSIEIRTFFSVCRDLTRRAGLSFNPPAEGSETDDYWDRVAPTVFCAAIDHLPEPALQKFDAIIVDEAQDFHANWWLPIQLLLKDPDHGRLCVFSDPEQTGIYGRGQALPEPLVPYQLRENCRNTRRIASYCGRILSIAVDHFPECPFGLAPIILDAAPDAKDRATLVRKEIIRLMDEKPGLRAVNAHLHVGFER